MKRTGILLAIVVFGGLMLLIYGFMGGFKEVEISLENCTTIRLMGVDYHGTPQDKALGAAFRKVEAAGSEDNPLHTVYFVEPAGKRDTLHVFVGVEANGALNDKSEWDTISFSCNQAVLATIEAHRLVMPGPENVKEKMAVFARENGVELQGIYIDKIIASDKVEIWAPVK
ncbi:hypothetical protein [Negadavirga shengliensis]|uniref:Uncharacterized protein n=1 Tax=Negadavirga shengliensis TaxID=1389218 RepID=A0ABV9T308_9BACT